MEVGKGNQKQTEIKNIHTPGRGSEGDTCSLRWTKVALCLSMLCGIGLFSARELARDIIEMPLKSSSTERLDDVVHCLMSFSSASILPRSFLGEIVALLDFMFQQLGAMVYISDGIRPISQLLSCSVELCWLLFFTFPERCQGVPPLLSPSWKSTN